MVSPARLFPNRPAWRRYGLAVVAVAVGWAARLALTPSIGPTALPFITFFPALAWAAWYDGLGPGVVATVLSALAANWFFSEPLHTLELREPIPFLAFFVASSCIVVAFDAMHRARRSLVSEVIQRQRYAADLENSRNLLSTTLASIGDAVLVTDSAGRVTFLNAEAERLTGWRTEEALGQPLAAIFRIVNEDTRRPVENPVEKVLRLGATVGLANHTVLIARDGRETPIDDSAAPVRLPGEPLQGIVLVFRDFTERRRAEAAQARLAAIVEASGDAIVSKDLDGTILTWNAGAERMFDYRAAEIVGKPMTVLIPPDHEEEENQILERLRSGQSSALIETVRLGKKGRRIPVSVSASPLHNREGRVIGASGIIRDMTEIVVSRNEVTREKELLATTLASIGDAVIVTDAGGRVSFLNAVARSLTGWKDEEALGRPLPDVFHIVNEKTRERAENPALRAIREGVVVGLANHTVLVAKSGEELPIDDSAAPIRNGEDAIVGAVLVFRDVTQRRRAEEELKSSRERLQKQAEELVLADRRKNQFLAMLAHELRNPLAPIRNSISLLQLKGPSDPELVAARDVLDRQVRHMTRLLDDLLDVNRLGRQKLELRRELVTLAAIVENAVETARPSIVAGQHTLDVALPADPVVLNVDAIRLSQVLGNLVNNAAKYMDPGGQIALNARLDDGEVIVSVKDSGVGIAPESLPSVFEMFWQDPRTLERAQGGIGIGLTLGKGLVELHGGTITAKSDGVGKGSEFVVRIPVEKVTKTLAASREQTSPPNSTKRRILIVDDLADNADTLAVMLRALGHDVDAVYDGASALAAAVELRPEVVLLDIGMPKMNGYDVCRRIREQSWGNTIFLIAQTGWGEEVDRQRTKDAGFDHHMLKPVDCAALVAVLDSIPNSGLSS